MGFVQKSSETQRHWNDSKKGWVVHDPRTGATFFEPSFMAAHTAQVAATDNALRAQLTAFKSRPRTCKGCGAPVNTAQCSYCRRED